MDGRTDRNAAIVDALGAGAIEPGPLRCAASRPLVAARAIPKNATFREKRTGAFRPCETSSGQKKNQTRKIKFEEFRRAGRRSVAALTMSAPLLIGREVQAAAGLRVVMSTGYKDMGVGTITKVLPRVCDAKGPRGSPRSRAPGRRRRGDFYERRDRCERSRSVQPKKGPRMDACLEGYHSLGCAACVGCAGQSLCGAQPLTAPLIPGYRTALLCEVGLGQRGSMPLRGRAWAVLPSKGGRQLAGRLVRQGPRGRVAAARRHRATLHGHDGVCTEPGRARHVPRERRCAPCRLTPTRLGDRRVAVAHEPRRRCPAHLPRSTHAHTRRCTDPSMPSRTSKPAGPAAGWPPRCRTPCLPRVLTLCTATPQETPRPRPPRGAPRGAPGRTRFISWRASLARCRGRASRVPRRAAPRRARPRQTRALTARGRRGRASPRPPRPSQRPTRATRPRCAAAVDAVAQASPLPPTAPRRPRSRPRRPRSPRGTRAEHGTVRTAQARC